MHQRTTIGGLAASRSLAAALCAALAFVLAGCATSGYEYVANEQLGAYFRVPDEFQVYQPDEVLEPLLAERPDLTVEEVLADAWVVAFDGSDEPAVDRFQQQLSEPSDAVSGYARVRTLQAEERLGFSLQSLRTELLAPAQVQQLGDRLELIDVQELSQDGGEGLKITFSVDLPQGTLIFDQMAVVDDRTSRVYLLAIGCSSECYDSNRETIAAIGESWTITEEQ